MNAILDQKKEELAFINKNYNLLSNLREKVGLRMNASRELGKSIENKENIP